MRFRNLKGLTDLPVDAIKHRFRNEHVLTVLPARGDTTGRDVVLVATPTDLAVVSGDRRRGERWMMHLAPWEVVRLVHAAEASDGVHRLDVRVGSLTFHAALSGAKGQKALGDFETAARIQRDALVASA